MSEEEGNTDYKISTSEYLLNSLFQKILDQQEETLINNFSIIMNDEDEMVDLVVRNEILQEQFMELMNTLTAEFQEIFAGRNSPEEDEFQRCVICMGDETPYIRLNCACKLMLHRECYLEYIDKSNKLKCPHCKRYIFQNYLE